MKSDKNIREGYKRTAVGVIPEEWEVKKLGKIAQEKGVIRGPFGGALKKEIFEIDGKYKVYQQRNAIYDDLKIGDYFINEDDFNRLKRFSIKENDFLISCSGTIGKITHVKEDFQQGVINQALLIFRTNNNISDSYFYQLFNSHKVQYKLLDYTQGGAMKNMVGMKEFKEIYLPIPPLPEQQAIANCLTTWDNGIEKLTQLIATKREQKKGLMQQLLTGKKRLDGFVGEWKEIKLGNIGTFRTSSVNKKIEKDETKVWLLNYMDVYNNTHITSKIDFQLTSAKNTQIASSNLEIGDVLFTPSSETPDDIGHSAVVTENLDNVVFSYHLVRFRPKRNILNIGFSGYVFNKTEILNEFSRRATGSTRYTLSLKDFNEVVTTIPPLEEQTAIAHILTTADQEISLLEAKLAAMKEEKKGLMQVLLTGEKRLIDS